MLSIEDFMSIGDKSKELFFDIGRNRNLNKLLENIASSNNIKKIYAAVAYTHSDRLIKLCTDNNINLEWWGLFDSNNSTDYDLIIDGFESGKVSFYPFANNFHPKVIYLQGYGVYIGSANMTEKALRNNIEVGVFYNEEELKKNKWDVALENFFKTLKDKSTRFTYDDIEKLKSFRKDNQIDIEEKEKIQSSIEENFKKEFKHIFNSSKPLVNTDISEKETVYARDINYNDSYGSASYENVVKYLIYFNNKTCKDTIKFFCPYFGNKLAKEIDDAKEGMYYRFEILKKIKPKDMKEKELYNTLVKHSPKYFDNQEYDFNSLKEQFPCILLLANKEIRYKNPIMKNKLQKGTGWLSKHYYTEEFLDKYL